MPMNARWRLRPHDPARMLALSRGSGLSPLVAQILINRGIDDPRRALAFLEARLGSLHDPELLPGAVEAAERIARAIRGGRKIVIYGDYDVDGVCGTSLLWMCLRLAGGRDVHYYIPHRVDEGYGVNAEALRRLALEDRAALIITVDCGISAVREAELARELGVELIITDHHTIGPVLPPADVVVHPRRPGGTYPSGDLCGAGVAFKLAWQVSKGFGDGKRASPHLRDFLVQAMGLVALATVADVVPLCDENRILVRHGLAGITAEPTVGLRALLEVSGCRDRRRLSTGTVGFVLGPRINAAGRLECAKTAVEMLTTEDTILAGQLASELDRCNTRRQEIERLIYEEARAMIEAQGGVAQRRSLVLAGPGWHPGVIGIVAGRLAEVYHRPTIVLSLRESIAQGSARSIPGFDLYQAIQACAEPLLGFGGHAAAAGLKLPGDQVGHFAALFEDCCRDALAPEQLERVLSIDAEVPLGVLSLRVVEELDKLEPYGVGNPKPLLLASNLQVVGQPRVVGDRKNHLQLRLKQGDVVLKAIGWNLAEKGQALAAGSSCSVVFHPSINEWNNRREVQLELKDFTIDAPEAHLDRRIPLAAIHSGLDRG
jgi:single-stranded-DNA-specific exonuclease